MSIEEDAEERKRRVEIALNRSREAYGQVPFITDVISEREDLFLGYSEFSKHLMFEPKALDLKTMELCAIASGSSLGADHCLDIHLRQACKNGAKDEEIFEAIMVGAFMAMTRSQATALRRFKDFQNNR